MDGHPELHKLVSRSKRCRTSRAGRSQAGHRLCITSCDALAAAMPACLLKV